MHDCQGGIRGMFILKRIVPGSSAQGPGVLGLLQSYPRRPCPSQPAKQHRTDALRGGQAAQYGAMRL